MDSRADKKNESNLSNSFAAPAANRVAPDAIGWSLSSLSRTKTNGRLGLICDSATSVAFILLAKSKFAAPALTSYVLIGLALFTFVEYAFHRWLFHGALHALERGHRQHHLSPLGDDSLPFFLPPMLFAITACLLAAVAPVGIALALSGGLAGGYALYGLSHVVIHRRQFSRSGPRRWAAAHHIHHHHPDKNFGVTSPLWDVIFRTRYLPSRPRAPDRVSGP